MAYIPSVFVDRSVEFPGRRVLSPVSGQADTFDVTRAEGTEFVSGTKPDATNLNAEFGKIKNETDALNNTLTQVQNDRKWNLIGTKVGTAGIGIGSTIGKLYNEYLVEVQFATNNIYFNIPLTKEQLTDSAKYFYSGYGLMSDGTAHHLEICIIGYATTIYLNLVDYDDTNYASTSKITVYGKY